MIPEIDSVIFESEAVDALTLTSKSVVGRAMLAGLYNRYAEEKNQLAYQKEWKALGYKGHRIESVRYGKRKDGSIIMCTGSDAMHVTHMLVFDFDYLELKTTRIDVCIDLALVEPQRGWLRRLRDSDGFRKLHAKAKRETKLIESDTGDTLYIGARGSGRLGRIYDKSLHYGAGLGSVYRFELETKRQVAPAIFKRLFPEDRDTMYNWNDMKPAIRAIVKGQFGTWGVHLHLDGVKSEIIRAEARLSTVDSQLEWLARSVKPMLVKLEATGYKQRAFDALGIPMSVIGD